MSQHISVNSAIVENFVRRTLISDSTAFQSNSLMARPILLQSVLGENKTQMNELSGLARPSLNLGGIIKLGILAPETYTKTTSHRPHTYNQGSLISAKGQQSIFSFGIYGKSKYVELQIKPEFLIAQNPSFDGFADDHAEIVWHRRFLWWNRIDTPERFGQPSISELLPGQSYLKFTYDHMSLAFSTENLWWGPGRRNSLIMSNNARGFPHLRLMTSKPIETIIGDFEGTLIMGRLSSSGFDPPQVSRTYLNNLSFIPKNEDDRAISGFTINYKPKWLKGLWLGYSQTTYRYLERSHEGNPYLAIFRNVFSGGNQIDFFSLPQNHSSFFFRLALPKAMGEIYAEYGLKDQSWNLRRLFSSIDNPNAVTFGFSKYIKTRWEKWPLLEISAELTSLQQYPFSSIVQANSWYLDGEVRQGYTNRGEVLGAAIGPGSNSQFIQLSIFKGLKSLSLNVERVVHNNDYFYYTFGPSQDNRRFWVDLNLGINLDLQKGPILISSQFNWIRSFNYQWQLTQFEGQPYYIGGKDVNNAHLSLKLTWLLCD
ncbi:capsule assembly Wzi family protein [Roseivirga misakiensis]|nr:capsule assembly Wzi family protein [Roseivirga misakiensis]